MCGWRSWAQARLSRRKRSRHTDGIGSGPPNDLDGDLVAKQRAVREIDLAHPAGGELAANLYFPSRRVPSASTAPKSTPCVEL